MLTIFLSYRASKVRATTFQFFSLSTLLATACGVGNELAEYPAQQYLHLLFSSNIYDTWLDLYANTFGIFLASIFLFPWTSNKT